MMTVDFNFDNWNRNAAKFVEVLGVHAEKVVKYETGQLLQTLVRVTPPRDVAKSRRRIEEQLRKFFKMPSRGGAEVGTGKGSFLGNYWGGATESANLVHGLSKTSLGMSKMYNTEWYGMSPTSLYGFTRDDDHSGDSIEALEKLVATSIRLKTPKRTYSFLHSRRSQNIRITGGMFIGKEKLMALIKRLKEHVGRLKAGWTVAFAPAGVSTSRLPKYVRDNMTGARGGFVNGLTVPGYPSFTIINRAAAVAKTNEHGKEQGWLQRAVNIRAKSMAKNFSLIFAGKKNLSDYAKGV